MSENLAAGAMHVFREGLLRAGILPFGSDFDAIVEARVREVLAPERQSTVADVREKLRSSVTTGFFGNPAFDIDESDLSIDHAAALLVESVYHTERREFRATEVPYKNQPQEQGPEEALWERAPNARSRSVRRSG